MYWYTGNKNVPVFADVELEISYESLTYSLWFSRSHNLSGVCVIFLPFLGVHESRLCKNRSFVGIRQEQAETEYTVHLCNQRMNFGSGYSLIIKIHPCENKMCS